jgi:hypothetical protein
MEIYMRGIEVPPEFFTNYASPNLQGNAASWFATLQHLDLSWEDFVCELNNEYNSPLVLGELFCELFGRCQNKTEPVIIFLREKIALARRIHPTLTDDVLVASLMRLLRPSIGEALAGRQFPNTRSLIEAAGSIEKLHAARPAALARPNVRPAVVSATKRTPPYPCGICGGPHWNRECPKTSGNAKQPAAKSAVGISTPASDNCPPSTSSLTAEQ